MKLSFDTIKSIIHGAMVVEQRDGNIYMSRFTDAHKPMFAGTGADEYRAESLTSVHLDFETDATEFTISFTNAWNTTSRPFFFFGLWIDDVLTEHRGYLADITRPIPRHEPDDTLTFALPDGNKRVSLYFPELFHLELTEVSLSDGAYVRPVQHKTTILAFGDSITEGHDVCHAGMDYIDQFGRALDAEVHNFGLGGARFRREIVMPSELPNCDIVTVGLGTNDIATDEKTFMTQMPGFLSALAECFPAQQIFVITPLWRADLTKENAPTFHRYRQAIALEAQKYANFHMIDGDKLVPHHPDFFYDLTLHPNDLGHTMYAMNLLQTIK